MLLDKVCFILLSTTIGFMLFLIPIGQLAALPVNLSLVIVFFMEVLSSHGSLKSKILFPAVPLKLNIELSLP